MFDLPDGSRIGSLSTFVVLLARQLARGSALTQLSSEQLAILMQLAGMKYTASILVRVRCLNGCRH